MAKHFLFLADEWGSSKGGLSTINREIAKKFARLPNVKVSFLIPPSQFNERVKGEAEECQVHLVKAGQGYVGFDDHTSLCFPPKDLEHVDVVIGHGRKLGPPAQPIRASMATAKPCVWVQFVHVASEDLGMYKGIAEHEQKHNVELALCTEADLVVAIGPKLAEDYSRQLNYDQKEVHTFVPGIFEEFSTLPQAKEPTGESFIILMFGRGTQEEFVLKGYELAAKAVTSLGAPYILKFLGAPSGEEEDVKKRLVDRGIPKHQLIVKGFCADRGELSKVFCGAHLVIMPSQTESFGLAALEAISAGVPVLVSGNSGLAKALEKLPHGKDVIIDLGPSEEGYQEELKKKIIQVQKKPHELRLVEAAELRRNYQNTYQWDAECEKLYGEIEKLFLRPQ